MGSQRRRAMRLMDNFVLSEKEAYELGERFEALELGDELSDVLYEIESGDFVEIQELYALVGRLAGAAVSLERVLLNIKKRKE